MSEQTLVTLSKRGTAERTTPISKVVIPDLYQMAQNIRGNRSVEHRELVADRMLECWHLAHDLKHHIKDSSDPPAEKGGAS